MGSQAACARAVASFGVISSATLAAMGISAAARRRLDASEARFLAFILVPIGVESVSKVPTRLRQCQV